MLLAEMNIRATGKLLIAGLLVPVLLSVTPAPKVIERLEAGNRVSTFAPPVAGFVGSSSGRLSSQNETRPSSPNFTASTASHAVNLLAFATRRFFPMANTDSSIDLTFAGDELRSSLTKAPVALATAVDTERAEMQKFLNSDSRSRRILTLALIGTVMVLIVIIFALIPLFLRSRTLMRDIRHQHLLLRVLIDAIPDQIYFKRPDGRLIACNKAAAEFVGMPAEILVGKTDQEIFGDSNDGLLKKQVFTDVQNEETLINQGDVINPAGKKYTLEMIKAPVIDEDGGRLGSISVWRDMSERQRTEAHIETLAHYDPLTKLANRTKAQNVLLGFLETHHDHNQFMALAVFDLDNFAAVNAFFGHDVGDILLRTIGTRLSEQIGSDSFAARLSSDEFLVLFSGLGSEQHEAQARAEEMLEALHQQLSLLTIINSNHIVPTTCVGAVLIGEGEVSAEEVLRKADLAMHNAKRRGRGQIDWFNETIGHEFLSRFDLENVLGNALANRGFRIFLQPKIYEAMPGRHFEVLLRLMHPERGIVSPGDFISVAESTGLIIPIGNFVLEEAARLLASTPDLHLAVNVSVQHLLEEGFIETLETLIARYGFEPDHLTLEMTESVMIVNFDLALSTLHRIRDLKVRLSIDDFGTGYSALVYLKQLPLDELKIDQTFVDGVPHEVSDTSLVELIIAMAHHLDLSVVAEGVENAEQAAWLRDHGCECLQGYHFSMPHPVEHYLSPSQ